MSVLEAKLAKAYQFLKVGEILDDESHLETAVSLFQEVLDVGTGPDIDNSAVLNQLGLAYSYLGKYKEAVEVLEKAIEIAPEPKHGAIYLNLGCAYDELGRFEDAVEVLEKGLETNKKNNLTFPYLIELGCVYSSLGEYKKAVKVLKEGINFDPFNPAGYGHLGDVYRQKGNLYSAEANYRKALNCFKGQEYRTRDDYIYAIRAERGLIALGKLTKGTIEQEALEGGILTQNQLDKRLPHK